MTTIAARYTRGPTATIERAFKAPVSRVWAMWTTKAGLERWYWPDQLVGRWSLAAAVDGGYEIAALGLPMSEWNMARRVLTTNQEQLNRARAAGITVEIAAALTWTGLRASDYGFDKVAVMQALPLGAIGNYDMVRVRFTH